MHHVDGSDSEVDFLGGLGSLIAADATVDSSLKLPHDFALVPSPEALVQPPKPALQRCLEKTLPGQRTPRQHALLTCHMRARKATYKEREEKAKENQRVIELANSLRHAALRVNALVVDRNNRTVPSTHLCVYTSEMVMSRVAYLLTHGCALRSKMAWLQTKPWLAVSVSARKAFGTVCFSWQVSSWTSVGA